MVLGVASVAQAGTPFSVMSLNLHGYHPMGETQRWMQARDGSVEAAPPDLFFFTRDELARGHARRLDVLASAIREMDPDVVFLQEVAAGGPDSPKDCETFYAEGAYDAFEQNSALRLGARLSRLGKDYRMLPACRGNTGWWTDVRSFKDYRILRSRPNSNGLDVVFDFGANPYPRGLVVEGFAVLVRKGMQILDQRVLKLPLAEPLGKSVAQLVTLTPDGKRWFVMVNLHASHKLRHFEYALAVRKAVADYLREARFAGELGGVVVGGDFNAQLYRPAQGMGEVSTVPWEIAAAGEYDFSPSHINANALRERLDALNRDTIYKPWENITDPVEARRRIDAAVTAFLDLGRSWKISPPLSHSWVMQETLEMARAQGACQSGGAWDASCSYDRRIDLIFADPSLRVRESHVLFSKNNWMALDGVSDHPGIFAVLE